MMRRVPVVLTVGETMALLRTRVGGPLRAGADFTFSFGGAESNVAIGLARLGTRAIWASRLGDDALGDAIVTSLRGEGVDVRADRDSSRPTGLMVKQTRASVGTEVQYFRDGSAASAMTVSEMGAISFDDVDALHVTGITPALSRGCRELIADLVQRARSAGVLISLDVNFRSRLWSPREAGDALRALLPHVDVLFGGHEELVLLHGDSPTDEADLLRALTQRGPSEVVIKRGSEGAAVLDHEGLVALPAFSVDVVDTVGAGDAFVAGYLASRLRALPSRERLKWANGCGALACAHAGDWEGSPSLAHLRRFLGGGDPVAR